MTPDAIAASGSESAQQKALFAWAAMAKNFGFSVANYENAYRRGPSIPPNQAVGSAVPELEWLFAIPNGGKRDALTSARLKGEGVKKGIHDVCWPLSRCGRHGLYIEMKVGSNTMSPEQEAFAAYLLAQGYGVAVCYSWREAASILQAYYSGTFKVM